MKEQNTSAGRRRRTKQKQKSRQRGRICRARAVFVEQGRCLEKGEQTWSCWLPRRKRAFRIARSGKSWPRPCSCSHFPLVFVPKTCSAEKNAAPFPPTRRCGLPPSPFPTSVHHQIADSLSFALLCFASTFPEASPRLLTLALPGDLGPVNYAARNFLSVRTVSAHLCIYRHPGPYQTRKQGIGGRQGWLAGLSVGCSMADLWPSTPFSSVAETAVLGDLCGEGGETQTCR